MDGTGGKRLPSFFLDDSTSDKYEGVADFFLAWTLRCAQEKYEAVDGARYTSMQKDRCQHS
jgi:hypothetical protein